MESLSFPNTQPLWQSPLQKCRNWNKGGNNFLKDRLVNYIPVFWGRVKLLPRQLGKGLLHCPLLRHWAREAPWSKYPVLQVKFTTSFKLNSLPLVIPWAGFPGWPHVIAVRRNTGRLASKWNVLIHGTTCRLEFFWHFGFWFCQGFFSPFWIFLWHLYKTYRKNNTIYLWRNRNCQEKNLAFSIKLLEPTLYLMLKVVIKVNLNIYL